jgi:lipopolysaccharide/colanic/teichoic acid biosynthesis glycosyltransferase/ADP-glucose pyrophosphorylase
MVSIGTGIRVNKAVLLIGGQGTSLTPLTKYRPAAMVPILNRPLIEHTISRLQKAGMTDIVIAGSRGDYSPFCNNYFGNNTITSPRVQYIEDDLPRGAAGVLRDLRDQFGDEPFLVVSGSCFLGNIDLDAVLDFHVRKKSILTIAVQRTRQISLEGIRCSDDGMVEDIMRIHPSRRRSSIETLGVYVFSPRALEYIGDRLYFDIKEQLVPALRQASLPVYAYETKQFCKALHTVKNYFDLQRTLLLNHPEEVSHADMTMIADGIWVGKNVTISPTAYVIGPVIIGSDSSIEPNTQIIGPAVIGQRCAVETGAIVRESILWDNVVMESGSRAQFSIVLEGLRVTSGESFSNTVIVDEAEAEDASLMASDHVFHGITSLTPSLLLGQKRPWYLFLKRFMDIVISAIVFVTMLPVLLIIALAVKLDSTGPVLFRQKRSGKGGNDFRMLKFRTMVQDAENQQEKLLARKDTDGPMFKLAVDPRTTRVGAFLRRTSLDELPQLINVLIGEMSLVGPRPLVMDEMKCSPSWREIRLRVKPGMTGLWQVSGRSEGHFHDWIRHDIHYVMNQSLWLDLKILFRTVKVVLKKVGAY